jgi:hypothetical protein
MLPKDNMSWTVRCFFKPESDDQKIKLVENAFENYCEQKLGGKSRQVYKEYS